MRPSWILATLLVSCAGNSPAQSGASSFGADIERLRIRHNIPGLSGLLVRGDSTLWEAGLGFRDLEQSLPVTAETRFHLASLTKPFAAVLAMQLAPARALARADVHAGADRGGRFACLCAGLVRAAIPGRSGAVALKC